MTKRCLEKTDVILCATYIPPENGGSEQATETQFAHFADELQHALNETPYLISCGDFNAQIGTYDEITGAHFDLLIEQPQLTRGRVMECQELNRAGKMLVDLASNLSCVITTGRTPGDTGQPTFVGYHKRFKSRPDHVMVSKSLFTQVHHTEILMPYLLDHCYQSVTFSTEAHNPNVDMRLHHDPICGPDGNFLRWRPEKAAAYVAFLDQDLPVKQQLHRAIEHEDVEQAWSSLKSWLREAAVQTGMTIFGTHARPPIPDSRRAAWFDEACFQKKLTALNSAMRGESSHIREQLFREYQSHCQRCKRRFVRKRHHAF